MYVPDLKSLLAQDCRPLADILIRFNADEQSLSRRYPMAFSAAALRESSTFLTEWESALQLVDFEELGVAGRVDYLLLKRRIAESRLHRAHDARSFDDVRRWLPFADAIIRLEEDRLAVARTDPGAAAHDIHLAFEGTRALTAARDQSWPDLATASTVVRYAEQLRTVLNEWHNQRSGYDPLTSWWVEKPYSQFTEALDTYVKALKDGLKGEGGEPPPITNRPLGRDYIVEALRNEFVAYSPEDLLDLAEHELITCETDMESVAVELGYPLNRSAAIEHIKTLHVSPGEQPFLAKTLTDEAVDFLERHDLITIPDHAKRVWRHVMISPEQQEAYPFLWGGETIGTSFAHISMPHTQKLSSMRSNNIPFLRATVHHELIPGHHLQLYMQDRFNSHRRGYGTPFYVEGWPLYWELLLYRMSFPSTPADRLGFLFWRMHRCARVIVVLGFHIGRLTIKDCLDLIINRVGHEKEGGTSQVRWLTSGGSSPLYGAAYMLGGLQLTALRRELVENGAMTPREFHDAVLAANSMPIELLRALLTGRRLPRDYSPQWRFAEDVIAGD